MTTALRVCGFVVSMTARRPDLDLDAVFIAIGHDPNTQIFCRSTRHERRLHPDTQRHRGHGDINQRSGRFRRRRMSPITCIARRSPRPVWGRWGAPAARQKLFAEKRGASLLPPAAAALPAAGGWPVPESDWNGLDPGLGPFVDWRFLSALEQAGSVGEASGLAALPDCREQSAGAGGLRRPRPT